MICLVAVASAIPSTLTFASEEPFKLGTLEHDGEEIIGVVLRDHFVIDLARANAAELSTSDDIITYGHGAGRAAHELFVLYLMGNNDLRLYLGSMEDWSRQKERPLQ